MRLREIFEFVLSLTSTEMACVGFLPDNRMGPIIANHKE